MPEQYSVVPLTPLRKAIAARMTEASRTIPHFRLVVDVRMDALLEVRKKFNVEHANERVSVNDCLIKACARALLEHPRVNSQMVDDLIHQYARADISVVVAVEGGLITPIVRQADQKSVMDIAREVRALADRAANGQLKMTEILGGSFSISNLGALGVDQFDAIINPPQCAILAVGRCKPRLVVTESRQSEIATVMRLTLSVDHRVIDGAVGAAFLATVRRLLEEPRMIFEP